MSVLALNEFLAVFFSPFAWLTCLFLCICCVFSVYLHFLCSLSTLSLEIFSLFVYFFFPPSCPPLPNLVISKLDCTFLVLPLTHLVPRLFLTICPGLFFCQHCPICPAFLYPDVCFSSPCSFFFSFQPSQSTVSVFTSSWSLFVF